MDTFYQFSAGMVALQGVALGVGVVKVWRSGRRLRRERLLRRGLRPRMAGVVDLGDLRRVSC